MTKASDNIFPKVTFVEGSAPASPAASDFSLYFDVSDHLLKWKNSAGTVTTLATGTPSGSITSSGYTQNTARLLGRTTGSAGAIEEITVGSGLSLSAGALTATAGTPTVSETFATGNVDLTGANNFVDVVSAGSLNGTYLLIANVLLQGVGTGGVALTARLTNGTAIPISDEGWDPVTGGSFVTMTLHAYITTSGAETWKMQAACSSNHGTVLATAAHNGTTNKATVIRAIKFA